MVEMGRRLHELRKKCGYTLDEVVQRVNIPKSTLSRLENGKLKTINRSYIDQLSELYGEDAAYILGYEDAPTVALTYSAPGKEQVNLIVDHTPIIGEAALRAKLYKAAIDVAPENIKIAIELLKTLSNKEGDNNAPK